MDSGTNGAAKGNAAYRNAAKRNDTLRLPEDDGYGDYSPF